MSALAKPVLRGHCKRFGISTMIYATITAAVSSFSYYFFISVPKKKAYHEFLRTYDEEAHMAELIKYGMYTYKKE